MFLFLMMACHQAPPPLTATEAYDVPPPPKRRSLRLRGAHAHPVHLGELLTLRAGSTTTTGDVVDHTDPPPELIVYVPEEAALDLLTAGTVYVVAPGDAHAL